MTQELEAELRAGLEEWRDAPGFPGYIVSNRGRVIGPKGRLLTLRPNVNGRIVLSSRRFGKRTVHSLVCEAFLGERPDGFEIDHIDGDPTNNHLANLEYVTHSENIFREYRSGRAPVGEKHLQAKLSNSQVSEIRSSEDSHRSLARQFGVSDRLIRMIRKGECRAHG